MEKDSWKSPREQEERERQWKASHERLRGDLGKFEPEHPSNMRAASSPPFTQPHSARFALGDTRVLGLGNMNAVSIAMKI